MYKRTILHCDLNNFFATASLVDKKELQDKPVAIAGDTSKRHGIILAKNMPAKIMGVKTAEPIWQAMQKCPNLITLPPDYQRYKKYSNIVKDIYSRFTGNIEPFGIDECWLDIKCGCFDEKHGLNLAYNIKETVKRETNLTLSIGVSFSKIFAKLGSDYKKPDAVTVISDKNYRSFVWPMPVRSLLFVGAKTEEKLKSISIKTIGDLANCDDFIIQRLLGKSGLNLKRCANGEDVSEVKSAFHSSDFKGIGNSFTTASDLTCDQEVFSCFLKLSDMVSKRLMDKNVCAKCISISLKDTELKKITRQRKLDEPIFVSNDLANNAMQLYMQNWDIKKSNIRSLGIHTSDFTSLDSKSQISFFDDVNSIKKEKFELAKKDIIDKYGKNAIKRASFLIDETPNVHR